MSNLRAPSHGKAAISGTFSDYRLVRSRAILQLVIEIPVERQAEAFDALGYPVPGTDIHVAVARLHPMAAIEPPVSATPSERGKIAYRTMSDAEKAVARAALLPKDPRFRAWCDCASEASAEQFIRDICCAGESRRRIAEDRQCYERFLRMEDSYLIDSGMRAEPR